MEPRKDWPIGPELRLHRERIGLSVKAAARRTGGAVSDGRWYQLESGYQQIRGQHIPISTKPETIAAAAKAVDWDVNEALALAGFGTRDLPQQLPRSQLESATDDELMREVQRRMALGRTTPDESQNLAPRGGRIISRTAPVKEPRVSRRKQSS